MLYFWTHIYIHCDISVKQFTKIVSTDAHVWSDAVVNCIFHTHIELVFKQTKLARKSDDIMLSIVKALHF